MLDKRLASDEWQVFLSSDVWAKFVKHRVPMVTSSVLNTVTKFIRDGDFNKVSYYQGQFDGIELLLGVMSKYHQELEQEVK